MSQGYNSGSSTINGSVALSDLTNVQTIPTGSATTIYTRANTDLTYTVGAGKKWIVTNVTVVKGGTNATYVKLNGVCVVASTTSGAHYNLNLNHILAATQTIYIERTDVDDVIITYYEMDA